MGCGYQPYTHAAEQGAGGSEKGSTLAASAAALRATVPIFPAGRIHAVRK